MPSSPTIPSIVAPVSPLACCLDHNDSSVSGVTPTPRWSPFARKESTHEDETPAHDAPAPTHVGRHAAPQLLCAYHARVSALCRRFRHSILGPPPSTWARSRSAPINSFSSRTNRWPGPPSCRPSVRCASSTASPSDARRCWSISRLPSGPFTLPTILSQAEVAAVTDHPTQPETPRHPHHALCGGVAGVRTVPVAGHRYRQRAHGPAGAARQRPARSVCHALAEIPPVVTAVLAAGETAALALSRPSPARAP